jgi:hypothetical protein
MRSIGWLGERHLWLCGVVESPPDLQIFLSRAND